MTTLNLGKLVYHLDAIYSIDAEAFNKPFFQGSAQKLQYQMNETATIEHITCQGFRKKISCLDMFIGKDTQRSDPAIVSR